MITKMDVLDGLETVKVCTGYRGGGDNDSVSAWLMNVDGPGAPQPVYEELPGWDDSTAGIKEIGQLPENARAYIRFIEDHVEAPVDIISTGPDRSETIVLRHPFD